MIFTWLAKTEPNFFYHIFEKGFFGLTESGTVKEARFIKVSPSRREDSGFCSVES